jgi:hypothetical protein
MFVTSWFRTQRPPILAGLPARFELCWRFRSFDVLCFPQSFEANAEILLISSYVTTTLCHVFFLQASHYSVLYGGSYWQLRYVTHKHKTQRKVVLCKYRVYFGALFCTLKYVLVDNSCLDRLRMSGSFQEQFLYIVSYNPTNTSPDYTELLSRCRIFIVNLKIDLTVRVCICSFLPTRLHKLNYRQR